MDYQNKKRVYELLKQISIDQNKGIIISTHDLDLAFKFPFNFYLIKESDLKLHEIEGFNDIDPEEKVNFMIGKITELKAELM